MVQKRRGQLLPVQCGSHDVHVARGEIVCDDVQQGHRRSSAGGLRVCVPSVHSRRGGQLQRHIREAGRCKDVRAVGVGGERVQSQARPDGPLRDESE